MKNLLTFTAIIIVIALAFTSPHLMFNPGELTAAHQKIKDSCSACHNPFKGIESQKCIACHKLSDIGTDTFKQNPQADASHIPLFHDKLNSSSCTSCHTDHKGLNPKSSMGKFNHNFLANDVLTNCNQCHKAPSNKLHEIVSVACTNCHQPNSWKSSGTFNHSQISDSIKNNCLSCHKKPADTFHSSFSGIEQCTKCHSTTQWKPSSFNHSSYFALDNNHNVSCTTCHTNSNYTLYTCYNCHEHSAGKISEEHLEHGISNFSNCVSCHKSGSEHDIKGMEGKGERTNEKEAKKVKDYIKSGEKEKEGDDD